MNPAFLDRMSWEMAEVYGAITDRILINLARYFPYMTAGHIPRSAFDYQAKMLAQMGKVNRESMQIIRDGLQGADKALARVLEQSIIDSIRKTEPELLDAVKAGIFKPAGIPIVAPNQMQAFSLYYHQAAQKLNLVNTVMLESTRQAYQATVSDVVSRVQATQTALDIGAGETLTGVSSWNMAMRHAIDRMKDNGITGFIDHAGRKWSAEAYAAMDIRTTVANTARAAVWEQNQNFGNDLYIVSYHDGARPLCYPWQNKVISSLNQARTVVDLDGNEIQVIAQSDTSYGEPAGLFGINCKHYPSPFIPGVSVLYDKNEIPSEKENKKLYEQTQQQRALERDLREKKRDLLIEKARGADKETLDALRSRCREASDEIDRFCDETGLPRRQNREGVFTKRDFPDADTYDVSAFERKQKEEIDKYFSGGGSQTGYIFGKVDPNTGEVITLEPNAKSIQTMPPTLPPPEIAQNAEVATFTPAKTRAEAEEYARQMFAKSVDYSGMSLDNINKVNETLTELKSKYPVNTLDKIAQKPQGSVARAMHNSLEINGKKLGKVLQDEDLNFRLNQSFTRHEAETMRKRYEGKARIPADVEKKIAKLEQKLKFKRYGVHSSYDDHVKVVISHEYGHILSDQYFGMINDELANPHLATNWSLGAMKNRWQEAFDKAWSTGDIFSLSEYGSSKPSEFFAECFAARFMGENLPDYVESLMKEVLENGIL